eukprot:324793_1
MCFWTSEYALCKPSVRAKELALYLFCLMIALTIITISGLIGGHYIVCIFSIGLIATMFCSIHNNAQYNIESTQRCVFFAGYLCIFSTIACCQQIANANIFTWIQLIGGFIFYGLAAYVSNQLYDELRLNCKK